MNPWFAAVTGFLVGAWFGMILMTLFFLAKAADKVAETAQDLQRKLES